MGARSPTSSPLQVSGIERQWFHFPAPGSIRALGHLPTEAHEFTRAFLLMRQVKQSHPLIPWKSPEGKFECLVFIAQYKPTCGDTQAPNTHHILLSAWAQQSALPQIPERPHPARQPHQGPVAGRREPVLQPRIRRFSGTPLSSQDGVGKRKTGRPQERPRPGRGVLGRLPSGRRRCKGTA